MDHSRTHLTNSSRDPVKVHLVEPIDSIHTSKVTIMEVTNGRMVKITNKDSQGRIPPSMEGTTKKLRNKQKNSLKSFNASSRSTTKMYLTKREGRGNQGEEVMRVQTHMTTCLRLASNVVHFHHWTVFY